MPISRSGLDALRGSIGMGQGNIRNQDTRSNDMYYNSPYNKGAEQPVKPDFASGGGLNQNPSGMQQQSSWNPYAWNGWQGGQTSNSPYASNVGGGFQQRPLDNQQGQQQAPQAGAPLTNAPTVGQPGQAPNPPNPSVPSGPTMPRFSTGTTIGNGADNPRRFMQRPSLSMQQMQQFRTPYRQPNPSGGYPPADGTIDPIYPPQPQGA